MTRARVLGPRRALVATLTVLLALTACGSEPQGTNPDPDQVDATEVPELGACRNLTPEDVAQPANASETVPCSEKHTAETFAIGPLPEKFDEVEYDDPAVGEYAYQVCSEKFAKFLGADESLVRLARVGLPVAGAPRPPNDRS